MVKDLATQLGLKNFQLIRELMDDSTFSPIRTRRSSRTSRRKICEKHGFVFEMERREKGGGVHKRRKW